MRSYPKPRPLKISSPIDFLLDNNQRASYLVFNEGEEGKNSTQKEKAMTKQEVFKKFVEESQVTIPRFTGVDDGGLGFLDQPDEWQDATTEEVRAAKNRLIGLADTIAPAKGLKFASVVASAARKAKDDDAEHIAELIAGMPEYVKADLLAGANEGR